MLNRPAPDTAAQVNVLPGGARPNEKVFGDILLRLRKIYWLGDDDAAETCSWLDDLRNGWRSAEQCRAALAYGRDLNFKRQDMVLLIQELQARILTRLEPCMS